MQKIYYLDANAIIKYSFYQEYLKSHDRQEDGVIKIRSLIQSQAGIFYCSNFALLECWHTLLKRYRDTQKCKVFGETLADQRRNIKSILLRLLKSVTNSELSLERTPLTAEILLAAKKLTFKHGIERRKIDSLDAIHLALVSELSINNQRAIILITSDENMIGICRKENINFLNPEQ